MSTIENKYIKAKIKGHYKFQNALEVKEVLGYDIRAIKGFIEFEDEIKELAERLICTFLNGHGLFTREEIKLISIKREKGKFILKYKDSSGPTYSYLYDNETVG